MTKKQIDISGMDNSSLLTVWSSELDTLLMRYEVNLTPYRIKSASNSLDQTVLRCSRSKA